MGPICEKLEKAMAYHCAPSLLGVKPADLFTWPAAEKMALENYRVALKRRGISLRCLRERGKQLLLVYRQEQLERCLACPIVRGMLEEIGYPIWENTEALLCHLSQRLQEEEFPHEIGLFLGYPPEDVEGFCRNQGQNYKLLGCWKVYGDAEAARKYFARCDRCRESLCSRICAGKGLMELLRVS